MMNELPNQEPVAVEAVGAAAVGARALGDGSSRDVAEVKPCPFCGHVGLDFAEGSTFRWLAYSCGGCGMGSETRVQTMGDGDSAEWRLAAERHAVTEWNRRAAIRCESCAGQGEVFGKDGFGVPCPSCDGMGFQDGIGDKCATCGGTGAALVAPWLAEAKAIIEWYAERNPKWTDIRGATQDPMGAHRWLALYAIRLMAHEALAEALERMDRARDLLTGGNPTPNCNWGLLDTSDLRALAASPIPVQNGLDRAVALIEKLRDEHCAGTQQGQPEVFWCTKDGDANCEYVAAWNDAIRAVLAAGRRGEEKPSEPDHPNAPRL